MPKIAEDYTIYEKKSHNSIGWYVMYRNYKGERMSALSLQKIKKQLYADVRKGNEPIRNKVEAIKIAEKGLNCKVIYDKIFNKKSTSPLLVDYVNKIWDYDNSPYLQNRIKEGNDILRSTCEKNISAFNKHIVPLLQKSPITLKDIDDTNGKCLTLLRDQIIAMDIIPTTKNKCFQSIRTAVQYAYERNLLKMNYKGLLKNTKIKTEGTDPLTAKEVNKVISYYKKNTEKGTYDRLKYLITALSATTGMREGEIMGLKKTDIKIDKKNDCAVLYINHAINTDNEYSCRKNKKGVYVATYIPLATEILNFSKSNPKKENYCFWNINNYNTHISKDYFKTIPSEALSSLGIKTQNRKISFYSMRKTAATITANLNNTAEASALLGHSDTYITTKHYISSTPEGAVNRFNQIRQIVKISA